MDDLDIAVALAFRHLLQLSKKDQKVVASEIGLLPSGVSKVLNFRQRLTFLQVHLFCLVCGFDISEMSKLVVKTSQDKDLLKSVREYQANKKQLKCINEKFRANTKK